MQMNQYLVSVWHREGDAPMTPEVMQQTFRDVDALNQELIAEGAWVFGGGLMKPADSTVVRYQDDDLLTTDGPFAEAKEHMGGFWVLNAPDLDAALALGARAARACRGTVEVRPFQDTVEVEERTGEGRHPWDDGTKGADAP
jgi:hypothetical protein